MASTESEYVLGTHDDELERLGLQHRVWRPRATAAWRRAGFTIGQTLLDIGCGPGYAAIDLAEIVGPAGQVYGIDRSARFLNALRDSARRRGLRNIEAIEANLDLERLPDRMVDGAWSRWAIAFLQDPRGMIRQISAVVRPGGVFVAHEYFAYNTWRTVPPCAEVDEFVRVVIEGWRATGGEPDIGLQLPRWLGEEGFDLIEVRPIVDVVGPESYAWQWLKSFIEVGAARYAELGAMTRARSAEIIAAFERVEREPNALMITPGLMEIIARRR